jgi:ABC-2 type transport system ATP-binding protein
MIQVQGVSRSFGARRAVDDVSFSVEQGTVLGFLGPNGAGKTTTMRMMAGYLAPTAGAVKIKDRDVSADPRAAQQSIGYMPENTPLYDDMTVGEFLRFAAEIRGFRGGDRARRADDAIARCALEPVRNQVIETLSKGYRRRTSLAQAILHDPDILLLDEPTEGLDPNQKQVVREMIRGMAPSKAIVLSTHVLEEVEAVCSRVIIISGGRIVADSTPAELMSRSRSHNAVTLRLRADAGEARSALEALPDVRAVEARREDEAPEFVLYPRNGRSTAASALALAAEKGWTVEDIRTDPGRLDDVFRSITQTDDVRPRNEE